MKPTCKGATLIAVVSVTAVTYPAFAGGVFVSNTSDSGAGSFRSAVQQANNDPSISWIQFRKDIGTVVLHDTVTYSGSQGLRIDGRGATLTGDGSGGFDLFVADGGGDLTLRRLTIRDSGENGLRIDLPPTATGELEIDVSEVGVIDNALFGLWIKDDSGSAAGVNLTIASSVIAGNGSAASDRDGVRVGETGPGRIRAMLTQSDFDANGADGIELDESGAGNVRLNVQGGSFNENGFQDPEDLDDGIDIDEAGTGDILASVTQSEVVGNFNEGLDVDEEDDGGLYASIKEVDVSLNTEEGVNLGEEDAGDLSVQLNLVIADGIAEEDGVEFEEEDGGDLQARVVTSTITNNAEAGIKVEQEDDGSGTLRLQHVLFDNNGDGPVDADGVEVIEVGR